MMLAKNNLAHIYDEKTSREIYNKINDKYVKLFEKLKEKFENV